MVLSANSGAAAQNGAPAAPFPDSAMALFKALAGHWSCNGGFARGGSLAADLTFTPAMDGHALSFEHVDRVPGSYWQSSTWAVEAKTGRIVSAGAAGSTKDHTGAPTLFVAKAWSPTSVTLEADTIKAPPFAPNRFTYSLLSANGLKMTWEVSRNGTWALGDSLVCARR